ncbi:VCBS repeat-containing protein [Pelagicoccus mobilis]|uniref:VCBS repeat-containing protein n=1 Tax=Pelagicoccus mobilis TaxID=415221 RepID=A0A934S169_9BACT|nr:VCBS repeat-containing protein [Pelagicoccus mobilis]MBK1880033.1 VCBS repeat-containing protein [Pelagicoccus mobilis]
MATTLHAASTRAFTLVASIAFAAPSSADPDPQVGFEQINAAQIGIDFQGSQPRTAFTSTQYLDNAGVAAGDFDGDGLCDLFFCGGDHGSQLYLNLGNFTFENVTQSAGLESLSQESINAATFADGDGDGDLDLFLGSLYGKSRYYLNNGDGTFSSSDQVEWQESPIGGVTSFALADIDNDGDLDLYTSRYLNTIVSDRMTPAEFDELYQDEIEKIRQGLPLSKEFAERFTVREVSSNGKSGKSVDENGLNDVLYLNDGRGRFTAALGKSSRFLTAKGSPVDLPQDWGLTSSFRDVDGDGDQDLYVCNDFESPDRFWINDGTGHFKQAPALALRRTSSSSMGVDFADIDLDGLQDFFVVDMLSRSHTLRKKQMGMMVPTKDTIGLISDRPQIMQNTLFLNRGEGLYSEIAQYAGLKASEWSWAPAFIDIDLDGYNDLIVTTGAIRDFMDADVNAEFTRYKEEHGDFTVEQTLANQKKLPPLPMRNFIFRNRGDMTFEDKSEAWGMSEVSISGGMAMADLDQDGDLDVVISNTSSAPEIYQNISQRPRLSVTLKGNDSNTQAVGARLVLQGGGISQTHEVTSGGIYASGSQTIRSFALPKPKSEYTLTIHWTDGTQSVKKIKAGASHISIDQEGSPKRAPIAAGDHNKAPTPLFEDVSQKLGHSHVESPYNDFAHQPLLPNRLSQLGPGISWTDLDHDGDDDLLIPSGRGGNLTILANTPNGFRKTQGTAAFTDQVSVLTSTASNGDISFTLGVSNHELQKPETVMSAIPFSFNKSKGWISHENLPASHSTTGPMSQADIDGDGDLDLFIGGRAIPGKYPEAADSQIFINNSGTLELDTTRSAPFKKAGLVSGSAFADIDSDGDQDLALALEWGPIKVFENDKGTFRDISQQLGLAKLTGWWNGVAFGDFNNDGKLDLVATNWGRNSKYEGSYSQDHPLEIFYGDLNNDGTQDVVEAHFDKQMQCTVPERGFSCSSRAMPFIRDRMKTFEGFGMASLEGIYGTKLEQSKHVAANTLEHHVFINQGRSFQAIPLPLLSQLSPAFGVSVADFDGDGFEDLFLAQNFFAVQVETPRNDAGYGLILRGSGDGSFAPLSTQESGIAIFGEQRGSAVSDYDRDGRVDIAVAQNGSKTKLFRNVSAKPGLRVRLEGTPENVNAIGATIRLEFENDWGPARTISSGSGYCSQETATPVLAVPSPPVGIEIAWPGRAPESIQLQNAAGKSELYVSQDGRIELR